MRTIKFRAWHKEEKVMCEVSTINFEKGAFIEGVKPGEDYVGDKYFVPAPENGRFCDWDEIELMQFTGLEDKNGKEIYEGDILKLPIYDIPAVYCGDDFYVVEFRFGAFRAIRMDQYKDRNDERKYKHRPFMGAVLEPILKTVEGNIHENPELLN